MFKSATFRLTAWYVVILAVICLLFSGIIYTLATHEVNARLTHFDTGLQGLRQPETLPDMGREQQLRGDESNLASSHLILELVYSNIAIIVLGGIGAYYLARATMRPIERAHEAQSRFTSDASHELRTPLASMQLELESILRDKDADTAALREILQSNLEEVGKMSALSSMLLNLSHLEYKALDMAPVNLVSLADAAIKRFRQSSSRLVLRAPKKLMVNGNETALSEVVAILLDNALKYSTKQSEIQIKLAKAPHDTVILSITNAGKGIKPDDLAHIFERFYRGDSARTSGAQGGFGLGLSLAQKIVALHHGQLSAESTLGKTTTFTVSLPTLR